jgi:hypothetical protein
MMKNQLFFLRALPWCLGASLACAEPAQTIRDTDLQAQSQSDSTVLSTLPASSHLDVLQRKGAWSQVKTGTNQTGWVRMLNLRFDTTAAPAKSDGGPLSALTGLLTTGRTSNTGTVTTGVKGLNEEDLKNAQPNQEELQKMEKLGVDKATGQAFGRSSKLTPNKVDYLPDDAKSGDQTNKGGT